MLLCWYVCDYKQKGDVQATEHHLTFWGRVTGFAEKPFTSLHGAVAPGFSASPFGSKLHTKHFSLTLSNNHKNPSQFTSARRNSWNRFMPRVIEKLHHCTLPNPRLLGLRFWSHRSSDARLCCCTRSHRIDLTSTTVSSRKAKYTSSQQHAALVPRLAPGESQWPPRRSPPRSQPCLGCARGAPGLRRGRTRSQAASNTIRTHITGNSGKPWSWKLLPIQTIRYFPILEWSSWIPHWICGIHWSYLTRQWQMLFGIPIWVYSPSLESWSYFFDLQVLFFCGTRWTRWSNLKAVPTAHDFSLLVCLPCSIIPGFLQHDLRSWSWRRNPLMQKFCLLWGLPLSMQSAGHWPAMSPACRMVFTVKELHDTRIHSIWVELPHDSSIQEQLTLLLSDLGWRELTRGCCSSLCNIETWVYCFVCEKKKLAIESQRSFAHLHFWTHVVASETENSNELLRDFFDEVLDVVRVLSTSSRFSKQEISFRHHQR